MGRRSGNQLCLLPGAQASRSLVATSIKDSATTAFTVYSSQHQHVAAHTQHTLYDAQLPAFRFICCTKLCMAGIAPFLEIFTGGKAYCRQPHIYSWPHCFQPYPIPIDPSSSVAQIPSKSLTSAIGMTHTFRSPNRTSSRLPIILEYYRASRQQ